MDSVASACEAAAADVARTSENASQAGSSGVGGPSGRSIGLGSSPPQPAIAGFTYRRPASQAVDAIRGEGWPKNSAGNTSARGHLYDSDGRRIDAGTLKPHRKGQAPPCTDLKEPWRSDPDYTTTWHAERDAAKIMRDNGLREAVLYLNIPTCGQESQHAKRCHANLEKVIPAGGTLWVWSIHEDGSQLRRRYRGTGEAIA